MKTIDEIIAGLENRISRLGAATEILAICNTLPLTRKTGEAIIEELTTILGWIKKDSCPKCSNPPVVLHCHGECLPDNWASWDLTPPKGWVVDKERTYLLPSGKLCIRLKKSD